MAVKKVSNGTISLNRNLEKDLLASLSKSFFVPGRLEVDSLRVALRCAVKAAQAGKVGFFNLETSDHGLIRRLHQDGMLTKNSIPSNLWFVNKHELSPEDILEISVRQGYQIIFIERPQLLQAGGEMQNYNGLNCLDIMYSSLRSLGISVVVIT